MSVGDADPQHDPDPDEQNGSGWVATPRSRRPPPTSAAFVAPVAIDDGLADRLRMGRRLVPVENVRGRGQQDQPENTALPRIEVDPDTYSVRLDGEPTEHEPATELPTAQRYFLF